MIVKESRVSLGRRRAPLVTGLLLMGLAGACTAIPQSQRIAAVPPAAARAPASASLSVPLPPPQPLPSPVATARAAPSPALVATIRELGRQFPGKVGIAVYNVEAGWTVEHNGDQLFPQQSVSKLWVAMTLMDAVDRGKLSLDRAVTIKQSDLTLFHQPIAAMVKGEQGYTTTLRNLLDRAMQQSDNTANDSILRTVGGPEAVRGYLARRFFGPDSIRFGPGERLLQSQTAGLTWTQDMSQGRRFYTARANLPRSAREKALDAYLSNPPDGASPVGIARALGKLRKGEMLSPHSTRELLAIMTDAKTGPQRVKAGVPAGWSYAHKTGTGQDLSPRSTGYNDVGIMTAPDGTAYAIAVMIGETSAPIPKRWELMQSVSRAVGHLHQPTTRAVAHLQQP